MAYPMGGMAWVGMNSRSFAYMAMSDRSPFERLMSDTCTHGGEDGSRNAGLQPIAVTKSMTAGEMLTDTLYRTANPAKVSSLVTCASRRHFRRCLTSGLSCQAILPNTSPALFSAKF